MTTFGQSTDFMSNTVRKTFHSEILNMNKSYQVFLPESYHYSEAATYPVVYLIDGDYNFYYQTGIIESMANVSEKIPEVIVVGISDNGNEGYRKDCTLPSPSNPNGNAPTFLKYIEQELKPEIKKQFKASSYEILIGHSLGGLFATNVFLDAPKSFSAYIAIDPSYWWDDYSIMNRADSLFKNRTVLESKFFVTLADTKQMGVHQFIGVLEKYYPDAKQWTFKHYENENHGSVGLISVRDGLLKIFEGWELSREKFYSLKTSQEVIDHYKSFANKYDSKLRLSPNLLSNIIYFYFRQDRLDDLAILEKEINTHFPNSVDDFYAKLAGYMVEKEQYEEAQKKLETYLLKNPKAFKSHDALSKVFYATEDFQTAKKHATQAITFAKERRVRQWQLNELQSNLKKITDVKPKK